MAETLHIVGPRIKVLVPEPKEETVGRFIIKTTEGNKQEDRDTGIVVQIGEEAYAGYDTRWCDLGDKVAFQRYGGKPEEEYDQNGKLVFYRILKDIDIIGVYKPVEGK